MPTLDARAHNVTSMFVFRSLEAISNSFTACAKVLAGDAPPAFEAGVYPQREALASIQETVNAHKKYWHCLGGSPFFESGSPAKADPLGMRVFSALSMSGFEACLCLQPHS